MKHLYSYALVNGNNEKYQQYLLTTPPDLVRKNLIRDVNCLKEIEHLLKWFIKRLDRGDFADLEEFKQFCEKNLSIHAFTRVNLTQWLNVNKGPWEPPTRRKT